ncbi:MAG: DUF5107 domain-containing protein [Saprospiraceae bacterium]|nr:DUF5107 domain-containing protein [Saprospiraceae bacterium]
MGNLKFECAILKKELLLILIGLLQFVDIWSQSSTITEENVLIPTYEYSDPDPHPILARKPFLYPFFTYDGYTDKAVMKSWKVITMENEYIKVFVLPEIGGKVWGAVDKKTGKEFLYKNNVVKFRNIALRGPWTSGGIEFNFGIIGHHPSTASPVDYRIGKGDDGSVSCFVGNIDWPSGTKWTVEIKLPASRACFETTVSWANNGNFFENQYHYITGAAVVKNDLHFLYPGKQVLEHGGVLNDWPHYMGPTDLSYYRNDTFGSHISVHAVGTDQEYMAGYYENENFGFGHWAPYHAVPGKKLWLWSTARDGGIWEDLLTDGHGQYLEYQAGRSLNQYSYNAFKSPLRELPFSPGERNRWTNIWFPFTDLQNITSASFYGLMDVVRKEDTVEVKVLTFGKETANISIESIDGEVLHRDTIELNPAKALSRKYLVRRDVNIIVRLDELGLQWSEVSTNSLKRPLVRTIPVDVNSLSFHLQEGQELKIGRKYELAEEEFKKSIALDSACIEAWQNLAELELRKFLPVNALQYANKALQINTYDPTANFYAGLAYHLIGDDINALESLGWAARSTAFKPVAMTKMAEILFQRGDISAAEIWAENSLKYDADGILALRVLYLTKLVNENEKIALLDRMLSLDPLDHFAIFEKNQLGHMEIRLSEVVTNELPHLTYLNLAAYYLRLNMHAKAYAVLNLAPTHWLVDLWKAYITKDASTLNRLAQITPLLVFPYLQEDGVMLEWAIEQNSSPVFRYLLALQRWSLGRPAEALQILETSQPFDFAPYYLTKAILKEKIEGVLDSAAYEDGIKKNMGDWRIRLRYCNALIQNDQYIKAREVAEMAHAEFPSIEEISMVFAKSLLIDHQYEQCIMVLKQMDVLPFEGSIQGKKLWESAHLFTALNAIKKGDSAKAKQMIEISMLWPENLGAGKPYTPDVRIQESLLAYLMNKNGDKTSAIEKVKKLTLTSPNDYYLPDARNDLINLLILRRLENNLSLDSLKDNIINTPGYYKDKIAQWVVKSYSSGHKRMEKQDNLDPKDYQTNLLIETLHTLNHFKWIK